jgi:hypothetical protein
MEEQAAAGACACFLGRPSRGSGGTSEACGRRADQEAVIRVRTRKHSQLQPSLEILPSTSPQCVQTLQLR